MFILNVIDEFQLCVTIKVSQIKTGKRIDYWPRPKKRPHKILIEMGEGDLIKSNGSSGRFLKKEKDLNNGKEMYY